MSFTKSLQNAGWVAVQDPVSYRKGSWRIVFDTSNWIEVGTTKTERIFDIPVPDQHLETWCINLIEHLCATDDRLQNGGDTKP